MATAPTTDTVLDTIRGTADNASAFLALNSGNELFTAPGLNGVVVYRSSGPYLIQFTAPFAAEDERGALLDAFGAHAARTGKTVLAVQLQGPDLELYASHGYTVNQVGSSYSLDLPRFTLQGTKFMQLRNKISRARRAGLTVREVDYAEHEDTVAQIDQAWLGGKGEDTKELEFLVGECGGLLQPHRRLFLGFIGDDPIGYISYSPAYGSRPGWLHDLSRRIPGCPPGTMELINATAIEAFRGEGVTWLHFGFTPFAGLLAEHEPPGASPAFTMFMNWFFENGGAVYPAKSQLSYKGKWAPLLVQPEYLAFQGPAQVAGLLHIFKAANAF
ncbi:DUF2156 domain-containing protein [Actinocorallia lasiicapitis]